MNKLETNNNQYWLDRWQNDDVGFCQESPNEFLVKHFSKLNINDSSVCLIPMCGCSIDMLFFLSKGVKVIGIELSEKAVLSFFSQNTINYEVIHGNDYKLYKGDDIEIYVADIFNLPKIANNLPVFDIWYDRGAYIALPNDLRTNYAKMMLEVCSNNTQILLLVMEHDKKSQTPPYSVTQSELIKNFSTKIKFELIDSKQRDNIPDYRKAEGMTEQYYTTYLRKKQY
ncbi:thiopurine S-methyltransferase [Francisella tularensis]|uniref:thiopurine S-methyltransferase n=2 Tax=Francisella tularensis subsp. holarctica TaxID=119857 RepID=A0AAJ1UHF8_FRATH|nr:thiopurine S-methyltransferase [Francisella tularensis]AFX69753.1 thiopurine S-methyltransferase [Francisella tularensis subsp. holarctica F92]AHH45627.1 thiopurine S-methyltransferase [Francisella tularensis subsp. holarctica PHIT-FT049]EBA51832.1 thiopurine S-methyltransferase [Francisella tularensis subsp. holarctica 257]ABI82090.1 thiopurine S-methyltransferase [Francisella tularensis subsp. holarctica OSU18]ABU60517.1 thiopurine S-methyltransferase [Francisella tularensis subsp. holarc